MNESTIILTEQERKDLALICATFQATTCWVLGPAQAQKIKERDPEYLAMIERCRALASRVTLNGGHNAL